MKKITLSALLLAASMLAFFSCSKEQAVPITTTTSEVDFQKVKNDIRQSWETIRNVQGIKDMDLETRAGQFIVVPAGSNNALVKAITDAGEGGIVYLRAGLHTETSNITIKQRVVLIGENGAVLKIKSKTNPTPTETTSAALHVQNAPRTLIQNIDIQPIEGNGGAAILMENSHQSAMMFCTVSKHQYGLMVEKSDQLTIMKNKITVADGWQTGALATAFGITIINGTSAYVADNVVSNAIFGIWACDRYGTCIRNSATGNLIGIILCNVPKEVILPSGEVTGSKFPGANWKVRDNISTDNFDAGYLVIDGANNNILENNQAARNGTYDIELTGDTYRFGFLTPLSRNNTVRALAGQIVKNCGVNYTVIGGNLVNNATDPCN